MTVRTLRITEQRNGRRFKVHVDTVEIFVRQSLYCLLVDLAHRDGWVKAEDLNANPVLVSDYSYRLHRQIGDPDYGGDKRLRGKRLIENDKRGNWRLAVKKIEWEGEFGRVPV